MGGLIGTATSENNGLMPKTLVPIQLTENETWYEITGDCSFYYRYAHPYDAKMAICSIMSNWSNANGYVQEVLTGGETIAELSSFVRVTSDNTKKKIYVRCFYNSDGSQKTFIIPIQGVLSINVTNDNVDEL